MSRGAILRETLYYGSDRQQQYWENEAQTLRIARDSHSLVWKVYSKEDGVYVPVPARRSPMRRRRRKRTESVVLIGRSAEEVITLLRRDHHLHLSLEQRLRRWIHKTSGERVLAFLDPNLGGAPVMTAPPQLSAQSQKKAPYA
jgi:hypothetical protein